MVMTVCQRVNEEIPYYDLKRFLQRLKTGEYDLR